MSKIPDFNLEMALNRIREIQTALQDGTQPFDESVKLFEEATKLIGQCRTYLRDAELKLEKLSGE
ncbi:MAG: exodeoxyribonuclease VII small subunit [Cytophagales bacterium]|jgi:exodeoxyribonuclease VII small subunit|nr:exodeoxyribonuclease VII small subunit [Cytophagales bacterium]